MAAAPATKNRRRFSRLPITAPVQYVYALDGVGEATIVDVGRGGMCLRGRQAIEPGHFVLLTLERHGRVHELKSQVAWVRLVPDGYLFGLRVFSDTEDAADAVSNLVYDSLEAAGQVLDEDHRDMRSVPVSSDPEWLIGAHPQRWNHVAPRASLAFQEM